MGYIPSRFLAILSGLVSLAFIAHLDYRTGVEISFSIFYLLPVSIFAWYGLWEGVLMSIACAAVWYVMDVVMGQHHYSNLMTSFWNTAVRFGFFVFSAITLSMLRRALQAARSASKLRAEMLHLLGHEFKDCLDSMDQSLAELQSAAVSDDILSNVQEVLARNRGILKQLMASILQEVQKDKTVSKEAT